MSAKKILEFILRQKIEGDDFSKVTGDLKKTTDELTDMEEQISKSSTASGSFMDNWAMMALGINQGIQIIQQAGQALEAAFDFTYAGAQITQTERAFGSMMSTIGMGTGVLGEWRDAVDGTISDLDLMSGFQTIAAGASAELTQAFAENNAKLLEISKAASALNPKLGDTAHMYESITTGVKRNSPMVLDNLGIIVKVGEANEKLAEKLGKTVDELTAEEKQMALLNEVIKSGDQLINQLGGSVEAATDPWDQFTAAMENSSNAAKRNVNELGVLPKLLELIAETTNENVDYQQKLISAHDKGIISTKEYKAALHNFSQTGHVNVDLLEEMDKGTVAYNATIDQTAEDLIAAAIAGEQLGEETGELGEELSGASVEARNFSDELEKITSLDANFGGMVRLAEEYDDILGDIDDKQRRIKQLMEIRQSGGYLDGVYVSAQDARDEIAELNGEIGDLQSTMEEMANQVVLDMLMATIAIDGVTEAEAAAYFQMAADMEMISQDAADAAIEAYGNAIDKINNMPIHPKTGQITMNVRYNDPGWSPNTGGGGTYQQGGGNFKPGDTVAHEFVAEGGDVPAGQPIIVGELGPEPLVLDQPGRVISNRDMQNGEGLGGMQLHLHGGPYYFRTEQETRALIERVLMEAARG